MYLDLGNSPKDSANCSLGVEALNLNPTDHWYHAKIQALWLTLFLPLTLFKWETRQKNSTFYLQ